MDKLDDFVRRRTNIVKQMNNQAALNRQFREAAKNYRTGKENNMEQFTIRELYTLEETIAADLFEGAVYPWELLPKISAFIVELGEKLPKDTLYGESKSMSG